MSRPLASGFCAGSKLLEREDFFGKTTEMFELQDRQDEHRLAIDELLLPML